MFTLEDRFLLLAILFIGLFAALYLYSRIRKRKTHRYEPKSIVVILLAFLLMLLAVQYSQQRPSNPVAVVVHTILTVVGIGFFGFLLWPFRDLRVFVGEKKYAVVRFFFVVCLYFAYFVIVSRGFVFLFNGIINPQIVSLTPEFERYVIPTLSGLVLAIYRLTKTFSSKATDFLKEISGDVVVFSLLMFWLDFATSSIGVQISADLQLHPFEITALSGLVVGITSVGFEGILIWVRKDLSKTGRHFSIERAFRVWFGGFVSKREKILQKTLDAFHKKQVEPKPRSVARRANEILDSRFSLHYKGRVLRASRILTLATLLMVSLIIGGFVGKREITVLAPAYSINLNLVAKAQLPVAAEVVFSESIESLLADKTYAIPIVSIRSSNISFKAPLSSRFLSLNSSQFMVLKTGLYLLIRLIKTFVETSVWTHRLSPIDYNLTDSSNFDYRGFFREAEIFYCLEKFGYVNITALSISSLQGFITIAQKFLFATNTTGCTVSIYMVRRSETAIIEDKTCFTSLDEDFMNQTTFLIEQTKSFTTCIKQVANATAPFRLS